MLPSLYADHPRHPGRIAAQIIPSGKDPAREALELFAIEGYRTGHLSEHELRRMLGYESRLDVHALLREHGIPLHFSLDDLEQDRQTISTLFCDSTLPIRRAE